MANNPAATHLLNATPPEFQHTSRIVLELEEKGEVVNVLLRPEESMQLNQTTEPTTKETDAEATTEGSTTTRACGSDHHADSSPTRLCGGSDDSDASAIRTNFTISNSTG